MADVEQIRNDIAALQQAEAAAVDELQVLSDHVQALKDAGAANISDADLEQLHQNIQGVTQALVEGTRSAQTAAGDPVATPFEEEAEVDEDDSTDPEHPSDVTG